MPSHLAVYSQVTSSAGCPEGWHRQGYDLRTPLTSQQKAMVLTSICHLKSLPQFRELLEPVSSRRVAQAVDQHG
jgi:hypothetical protein